MADSPLPVDSEVVDGAPMPAEETPAKRPWNWRRTVVRVRRFVRRSFWSLVLLLVAVVALASQTGRGQDIVLRAALNEVRSSLAGELRIDGIRSGTLLTGATLSGVRLDAAGGSPFLHADSVVLRYSLLSALIGGSPIRSTTLWGAEVVVSRFSDDEPVNVSLLLTQGDSASSSRSRRPMRLGHFGIREGRALILSPADAGQAADTMGPEGEPLKRLTFEELDLDVENAVLGPGAGVLFEARLASLSSRIGILDEPIQIREVFGTVTFGEQGIRIDDTAFRLPGSLLEGDLRVGPRNPGQAWTFEAELRTRGWADLADVGWLDPRIPEGRFRGGVTIGVDDRVSMELDGLQVELEASDLIFDGRAAFTDVMILDSMDVTASPVTLERLEPWLQRVLPLDGWLSGTAMFSGTMDDLVASGRVTLVPTGFGGSATTAEFDGRVRQGEDGGARGFRARLDPLNYSILEAFWPELTLAGTGSATIELDGNLDRGMEIAAELMHRSPAADSSEIDARGYLWRGTDPGSWITDLTLDLHPLSVASLAPLAPDLGLSGSVAGPARVQGRLSDMNIAGELVTTFGRVDLDSRFNLRAPASNYRVALAADSFPLSRLSERLPRRTLWTGALTVEGSGFSLDSADVAVTVAARDSRVGTVRVDTVAAAARVAAGVLITDSIRARVGGIDVEGRGRFGLAPGRWGASNFEFSGASLVGLRALVMGVPDTILVSDGLSELDRELLRVQGIDPDTLPTSRDVRFDGQISGSASLSGSLDNVDVGLIADVVGGAYQQNQVDSARVAFIATRLPATLGEWQIGATATGIVFDGREFARGGFEADMFERAGDGRIEIVRRPGEEYRASGAFSLDSIGGTVSLVDASMRVDDEHWLLTRAGPIEWGNASLTVDSVEIARAGVDPMRLVVDGDLVRAGQSDFRVLVRGLHAEQLLHVAQITDYSVGGHVDADLSVRGTSRAPVIEGAFSILGPRYGTLELTRLEGSLAYEDQSAVVEVQGWDRVRRVVTGSGTLPLDLGFVGVEQRVLDSPMDLRLATDSLDAAIALSYLSSFDGVLGTVSGEVVIGGTPRQPEPDGTITLRDGAWSIEAIGVRHTGVGGELRLRPDRTVDVQLSARAPGRSDVTGTVTLEPVTDPELDLAFTFDRFLAVSRADIEGFVSGGFQLTGTYTRPVASGALTVDEAAIFVDELQRAANVVDLSDPFLFDLGLAVDTTALVSQPLFAGLRNPFFDNLRVNVDLSVPRGSWLRSIDTNVEMSGDLLVVYDRSAGDFVLIGELQAIRGSHRVLGRTFGLDGGRVGFIGRPGLNPDLDIEASTRIRSPGEAPIRIDARVTGTLVQPVVTLSSEEAGLAEEDLISYLIFGQPSGALGGTRAAGRIQDVNAVSSAIQGGVTFIGGAFANQLGAVIAEEFALDYVSVQQVGGTQTLGAQFVADAQVELGRYLGDDVFVIVVLRPFDAGPQDQNNVAGLRVEVALTDNYNVELFREDRFLRSGSTGLRSSSTLIDDERVLGVFLFREWGYSPTRDR
ncbi:MAG: translocation/assembly module TamB [Gemmatimonadota bacterium]|nr:translocation/assembly module TamB [Gemmatimonadota bacterium]